MFGWNSQAEPDLPLSSEFPGDLWPPRIEELKQPHLDDDHEYIPQENYGRLSQIVASLSRGCCIFFLLMRDCCSLLLATMNSSRQPRVTLCKMHDSHLIDVRQLCFVFPPS